MSNTLTNTTADLSFTLLKERVPSSTNTEVITRYGLLYLSNGPSDPACVSAWQTDGD